MAVIMAEGLFHLKRNVCALIHAGSCYKIEGQFILKKILTTMICTCKVRNEIQTKRNEAKPNEAKRSQRKGNETNVFQNEM
jgi:hypothetical protein